MRNILLFILLLILLSGTVSAQNKKKEKLSGRKYLKTNILYNQALLNPSIMRLPSEGIILAFEKVSRRKHRSNSKKYTVDEQYSSFNLDPSFEYLQKKGFKKAAKVLNLIIDDPRPLALTHWFSLNNNNPGKEYSVYDRFEKNKIVEEYDIPQATVDQYVVVVNEINQLANSQQFTHIIIASTGWNTEQTRSLNMYRNWIEMITEAAQEDGLLFKPIFIGLTWESSWGKEKSFFRKIISIFNKSNDADEIGITHINYLLWQKLMPTLRAKNPEIPVVAIGHSLGARIVSTAGYSRSYTKASIIDKKVDLIVNFQPAFPARRFSKKSGTMGGFYTLDSAVKKFVATTSRHDLAMNAGIWTTLLGDEKAIIKLKKDSNLSNRFNIIELDATGNTLTDWGNKEHLLVNADRMINSWGFPSGSHNDVQDKEAGKFLWNLIKEYAPYKIK